MTILNSVNQFCMMPLNGLSQGAQPIVSFNYGAKNVDRVQKAFKLLLKSCVIYSVALWSISMFLPKVFILIFTSDSELIKYTMWAIRIYMAGSCLFWYTNCLPTDIYRTLERLKIYIPCTIEKMYTFNSINLYFPSIYC